MQIGFILLYTHLSYFIGTLKLKLRVAQMDDNGLIKLAEQVGRLLKEKKQTIATAESCTGGLIAAAITEIPGSSAWFDRGFVTYSNKSKMDLLDVNPGTLEQFGAVSSETARAMAAGALANSDADWAIAVTGIAGPEGGSHDKPVGTVFIAWQKKDHFLKTEKMKFTGNRQDVRQQTIIIALTNLLTYLKI